MLEHYWQGSHCLVAKSEERSIGILLLQSHGAGRYEIMNLAVAPDYQRQGNGRRLIAAGLAIAQRNGAVRVEVATGHSSVGPLALYQRCGFALYHVEPDYFTRHYPSPIYEDGVLCRDQMRLHYCFDQ